MEHATGSRPHSYAGKSVACSKPSAPESRKVDFDASWVFLWVEVLSGVPTVRVEISGVCYVTYRIFQMSGVGRASADSRAKRRRVTYWVLCETGSCFLVHVGKDVVQNVVVESTV